MARAKAERVGIRAGIRAVPLRPAAERSAGRRVRAVRKAGVRVVAFLLVGRVVKVAKGRVGMLGGRAMRATRVRAATVSSPVAATE
jgi:hypothetical protein